MRRKPNLVSRTTFAHGLPYDEHDPSSIQKIADIAGVHRVAVRSAGPPLILDDADGWTELYPGQWAVVCEEGCLHHYSDDELTQAYEEIH